MAHHKVDPTLRPLQVDIYMAVREAWLDYGEAPTKQALQLACRCSHTTVQHAVAALRDKGYLIAPKHVVRGLRPTDIDLTLACVEADPWDEIKEQPRFWKPDARR